MKEKITISLSEKSLSNVDSIIDNIFIRNRSQAIEYLIDKKLGDDKTAVILATGSSEGLRISKDEYRPTARIASASVIEIAIDNLKENGFRRIFVVGEQPVLTSIFNLVGDGKRYGMKIFFVEDKDPPGTAASLRLLKGELKSTFLVLFGDIVFSKNDIGHLWKHHFKHRGTATLLVSSTSVIKGGSRVPVRSSLLQIEGDRIVEFLPKSQKSLKSKEDSLAFSCMFVAEPELFSYSGNWLEGDAFPNLAEKGFLYSYISNEGEVHIHSKEDRKFVKI